ncbi:unnamed protein product [Linum tenue]|uniref:phosphoribosylaminoimidazolesuccinocarboxamide synthase n=1 Tax=Linum tenue TaxID=586396 RepID=A0AAV0NZ18_9ROSI|nr:unnamed protein product [Linum tenue]
MKKVETVGQAIDDIGATVWKSMAQIISHEEISPMLFPLIMIPIPPITAAGSGTRLCRRNPTIAKEKGRNEGRGFSMPLGLDGEAMRSIGGGILSDEIVDLRPNPHLDGVHGNRSSSFIIVIDWGRGSDLPAIIKNQSTSKLDSVEEWFKDCILHSVWWLVWKERNQRVFDEKTSSAIAVAKKAARSAMEWIVVHGKIDSTLVRGYVTGSTDTSLWTIYNKGVQNYCGNALPDGLVKNQKLQKNIITPTTKVEDDDVPITTREIIRLGLMTEAEYDEANRKALSLFEFGRIQRVAFDHGLILVDKKYEFGKGSDSSILLVDEEFLRLWFKNHCNPYKDEASQLWKSLFD